MPTFGILKGYMHHVQGAKLWVSIKGAKLILKDERGLNTVTIADVHHKNGVIHAVDSVLMPK